MGRDTAYKIQVKKITSNESHEEWHDSKLSREGGRWHKVEQTTFIGWRVHVSEIHPDIETAKAAAKAELKMREQMLDSQPIGSGRNEVLIGALKDAPVSATCGAKKQDTQEMGVFDFLLAQEQNLPSATLDECTYVAMVHCGISKNSIQLHSTKEAELENNKELFRLYERHWDKFRKYGFRELSISNQNDLLNLADCNFSKIVIEALEEALDCEIEG
jgi:hypothetical protein